MANLTKAYELTAHYFTDKAKLGEARNRAMREYQQPRQNEEVTKIDAALEDLKQGAIKGLGDQFNPLLEKINNR